jgi:tetratricopeptide (TPR) repeat protein
VFGKPSGDQITISEKHFPLTFGDKEIKIGNLISDCVDQLGLDRHLFSYEIYEDIRDISGIPYSLAGRPHDCDLMFNPETGKYVLVIARNILKYPNWLIATTCYQFSKAKLDKRGAEYETTTDTNLFLYLAATYLGYGVIIGQNLIDQGRFSDSVWETKWVHKADIPGPVLAYALAAFAKMRDIEKPEWEELLPADIKKEFAACLKLLNESDEYTFDLEQEEETDRFEELYNEGNELYSSGDIERAISTLQICATLSAPHHRKTWAHNNIGYYKQILGDYESSIPDFENALQCDPDNGYANDNLGLAWIMAGDPDKGLYYLEKAIQTGNNHPSYSLRNMAMYFHVKGQYAKAEEYFQKAFERGKPVDLLDFFYGRFLVSIGDRERGIEYIRKSAEIGEPEGIEALKRIL